jgi:hypothetical protein
MKERIGFSKGETAAVVFDVDEDHCGGWMRAKPDVAGVTSDRAAPSGCDRGVLPCCRRWARFHL